MTQEKLPHRKELCLQSETGQAFACPVLKLNRKVYRNCQIYVGKVYKNNLKYCGKAENVAY